MRTYRALGGPLAGSQFGADALGWASEQTINDALYLSTEGLIVEYGSSQVRYHVPGMRDEKNKCECCGRADWVEAFAYSIEEAIDRRWLIPVEVLVAT